MPSRFRGRSAAIAAICLLLGSFAQPAPASGQASVTDSAGVRLVRNPATPLGPPLWRVEPGVEISERTAGPEAAFERIEDVALDSNGRVLVLDGVELKWFDAEGRFLYAAGRFGEGPGEFTDRGPFRVLVGAADSALVPDGFGGRAAVFAPDGSFGRQFGLVRGDILPRQWKLGNDGAIVARRLDRVGNGLEDWLVQLDWSGDVMPSLGHRLVYPGRPPSAIEVLLAAAPVWTPLSGGGWAVGHSHEHRVTVLDSAGAARLVFTTAAPPNEVTEAQRADFLDRWRRGITAALGEGAWSLVGGTVEGPYEAPLITDLMEGPDGTIWVERAVSIEEIRPEEKNLYHVDGHGSNEWDVYSGDGVFLFTLALPSRFDLRRIAGSTLVGIQRDAFDVQTVHTLRLVDGGGG